MSKSMLIISRQAPWAGPAARDDFLKMLPNLSENF